MDTSMVFWNGLIMMGLLVAAAGVVLLAVRFLAGRGICPQARSYGLGGHCD